jgi:rRNA maturation endonuclease Nob1
LRLSIYDLVELMKIIKRGKVPEPKIYRYTCPYCHTVFECSEKESLHDIYCPVCHKLVAIEKWQPSKKIEPWIKRPQIF